MKYFILAFQRCLSSLSFMLFLVLLVLFTVLFSGLGQQIAKPRCGVVNEDDEQASIRIALDLEQSGLIPYADRQVLMHSVAQGELDCGFVILSGFEQKLNACQLEHSVMLVRSSTSVYSDLYSGIVGSALFAELAPHLTDSILSDLGLSVSSAALQDSYHAHGEDGLLFTFDLKTEYGGAPVVAYAPDFFLAILSLLLFIAVFFGAWDAVGETMSRFSSVIGPRRALRTVVIPYLICRILLVGAGTAVCFAYASLRYGVPVSPALAVIPLYLIVLTAAGTLLSVLLPAWVSPRIILPFWLLASMVLCPVFVDISVFVPALKMFKLLLPPCWLYGMEAHPLLWLGGTAGLVFLSLLAVKRRYGR